MKYTIYENNSVKIPREKIGGFKILTALVEGESKPVVLYIPDADDVLLINGIGQLVRMPLPDMAFNLSFYERYDKRVIENHWEEPVRIEVLDDLVVDGLLEIHAEFLKPLESI